MTTLRKWLLAWLVLLGGAVVAACHGRILPSRGMTVQLHQAHATQQEVVDVAMSFLHKQGFHDLGNTGIDAVKQQKTALLLAGPNNLDVGIMIHDDDRVLIRVSQRELRSFSTEAGRIFDALAGELAGRWPQAVERQAISPGR